MVGDLVMVDKENMPTQRPLNKLDHRKVGPFQIIKAVRKRAYHLQFLEGNWAHLTYHVQMVERYWQSAESSQQIEPSEPKPIDGEENWPVQDIADSHRNNRKKGKPIEYLVL